MASALPNQTSLLAAACSTTFFLRIGEIGESEDELGTLPASAQPMQLAPAALPLDHRGQ